MSMVGQTGRGPRGTRLYILIAAILVVVIVVVAILLVTKGLPALRGEQTAEDTTPLPATATRVPTFTPGSTSEPTQAPEPSATPAGEGPLMAAPETVLYRFESAGGRPSTEWTGFFGTVVDAAGNPLADVPLIVWYSEGALAGGPVRTDEAGYYEVRLADAPHAGTWTIQVLTDDERPASELLTFQTDVDTAAGVQQLQVLWKRVP